MSGIDPLFLPELNPQITEDLSAKPFRSQCLIQNVWQPPAGIQNSESPEKLPRDDIFTGRANDQGATELALSGWLTQTAALAVEFSEHAISKGMVRGTNSSCARGFWPQFLQGCR